MTSVATRFAAVTTAAAFVMLGVSTPSASAHDAPSRHGGKAPASPSAHVWITTPDGKNKLTDSGSVSFAKTAPGYETVTVDPTRKFQTMTGFGGSITDSSATLLSGLSPSKRDTTMHQGRTDK